MAKRISKEKACKIMRHGSVHGKTLNMSQKKFFGFVCGGGKPRRKGKK